MNTSKLIKLIREKQNLTQASFGEKISVGQNRISEWESGKKSIGFNKLVEICNKLNMDLCSFMCNLSQEESFKKKHKNEE